MNRSSRWSGVIAAGLLGLAGTATPACAQDARTVDGMIVNLGLMPADVALTVAGHREAHPAHPPQGSEHLLITLDDQRTGRRIDNAEVAVEVTDSHGHVQKKTLLHTQAAGLADYSELFTFGASGKYSVRVVITPAPNAQAVETRFTVNHVI